MRMRILPGGLGWLSGLLLLVAAGCTVSIQPWSRPAAPVAGPTPENPLGPQYPPGLYPGPGRLTTPPNAGPPGGVVGTVTTSGNEQMVLLIKQLNEAEGGRLALQEKVYMLTKQVRDREDNLRLVSGEIDDSTKQIKRTRDEFRQWQAEMDELRDRVKRLESERSALKPLIEDILHQLDRDREPPRLQLLPKSAK